MEFKLKLNDPARAREYFEKKMAFTTGPAELKYFLEQGEKPCIIDVRTAKDFLEGHVPGAINLPEDQWHTLRGLAKDRMNIVYCYSTVCHLSARASLFFAGQGYPVMELEGGMEAWRDYYESEVEKGQAKVA